MSAVKSDYQEGFDLGREEGFRQGREEGLEQARQETLKFMHRVLPTVMEIRFRAPNVEERA